MPKMLKNHDLDVILAPMSHLINLIFRTYFKISPPKMIFAHHSWYQDLPIISKNCASNLFEITRVEILMSLFSYISAAITECQFYVDQIPV